jgi:hypothetical protein
VGCPAGELGGVRDRDRLCLERVSSSSLAARRCSAVVRRPRAVACSAATRRAVASAIAARICKEANLILIRHQLRCHLARVLLGSLSTACDIVIEWGGRRIGSCSVRARRLRGRGVQVLRLGVESGRSMPLGPPEGAMGIAVGSSYFVTNLSLTS